MQAEFSFHAEEKLKLAEVKKFKISKGKIKKVLDRPEGLDDSEAPVLIAVGKLSQKLSLCVAYKKTKSGVKVITFYPAERGRYERKILQRR